MQNTNNVCMLCTSTILHKYTHIHMCIVGSHYVLHSVYTCTCTYMPYITKMLNNIIGNICKLGCRKHSE